MKKEEASKRKSWRSRKLLWSDGSSPRCTEVWALALPALHLQGNQSSLPFSLPHRSPWLPVTLERLNSAPNHPARQRWKQWALHRLSLHSLVEAPEGCFLLRHGCHTLLWYCLCSTNPNHALQGRSLKYFKWKSIPEDTWPNRATGGRGTKKLEGAGWRPSLEFLGSLDYMKKDLGRDQEKLKLLHCKQGSEATGVSWSLPWTK